MIYHLFLFELKNLTTRFWHLVVSGIFIFLSLFFASLIGFNAKSAIFFILFLSSFLVEAHSMQEDINDGTLCLIKSSPITVEIYYLVKLSIIWSTQYLINTVFVFLGSIFFQDALSGILQVLILWAPVLLGLTSLLHVLKLLESHSGVQYILALPLALPVLLFYQGAIQSGFLSFEAKILYALCLGLTVLNALIGTFLLKKYLGKI